MKKVKLIALALAACSLGLASCGSKESEPSNESGGQTQEADEVVSVSVSGNSHEITLKQKLQLSATVEVKGNASQTVTWSSSKSSVATVSENGLVTPVATGEVVITAESTADSSKKGTFTLTVIVEPKVLSVTVSGEEKMLPNSTQTLTATVEVEGGASQEVNWISLTPGLIEVSAAGVVTSNSNTGSAAVKAVSKFDEDEYTIFNFNVSSAASFVYSAQMPTVILPGETVDFSKYVTVMGDSSYSISASAETSERVTIDGLSVTFDQEGMVSLIFSAFGVNETKEFECAYQVMKDLQEVLGEPVSTFTMYELDEGQLVNGIIHTENYFAVEGFGENGEMGGFMMFDPARAFEFIIETEGEGQEAHEVVSVEPEAYDPWLMDVYGAPIYINFEDAEIEMMEMTDGSYEPYVSIAGDDAINFLAIALWCQNGRIPLQGGMTATLTEVLFTVEDIPAFGGKTPIASIFAEVQGQEYWFGDFVIFTAEEFTGYEVIDAYMADEANIPAKVNYVETLGLDDAFISKDGNKHGAIEFNYGWYSIDGETGDVINQIDEPEDIFAPFDGWTIGNDSIIYSDNVIAVKSDGNYIDGTLAQRLEGDPETNVVYSYDGFDRYKERGMTDIWADENLTLSSLFNPEIWSTDYIYSCEELQGGCYLVRFASTRSGEIVKKLISSSVNSNKVMNAMARYEELTGDDLWSSWNLNCTFVPAAQNGGVAKLEITCSFIWDEILDEYGDSTGEYSAYVFMADVVIGDAYESEMSGLLSVIFAE